jgi:hypothetical protein
VRLKPVYGVKIPFKGCVRGSFFTPSTRPLKLLRQFVKEDAGLIAAKTI